MHRKRLDSSKIVYYAVGASRAPTEMSEICVCYIMFGIIRSCYTPIRISTTGCAKYVGFSDIVVSSVSMVVL